MDNLLADFVAESREMLEASQSEIVAWESNPDDRARLDKVFRFVHTVKGNCGFFDFPKLARLSHYAEDALSDLRKGSREANPQIVTAVLAMIDRIAEVIDAIDAGAGYPNGDDEALIAALELDSLETSLGATMAASPAVHEPASAMLNKGDKDPESSGTPVSAPTAASTRSIRVTVDLLDRLMSGISDMVLARNDLAHRLRISGDQPAIDGPFGRMTSILSDVRETITQLRMQRIETLFSSLPRLARDLSTELGKQVMIDLDGSDVELDREMIEVLRDPLTHIIRNAIDHGIESPTERLKKGKREIGILAISARQSGNAISVSISDDGEGLNEEKIAQKAVSSERITAVERGEMSRDEILQLIFEPGFSTAEAVSNISGRGVGLDVVRDNLEKVGGSIKVSSQPGDGTVFTLQVPLTLSIIAGLTVTVADQHFTIPQSFVDEIALSTSSSLDITQMGEKSLVTYRGDRTPCVMLGEALGLPHAELSSKEHTLVFLRLSSGGLFALAVDAIHQHGDLVVKPLAPAIMRSGNFAGSTLLDDGQPILLLDIPNIASRYGIYSDARARLLADIDNDENEESSERDAVMLFTSFDAKRCAVRLELVQRIETVSKHVIERENNSDRAVIDGAILPLIGLPDGDVESEKVRLLRLSDGSCELLIAVQSVDDTAELTCALTPIDDDPLFEAVTLVNDRTVSLIDGHQIFAIHGKPPENVSKPRCSIPDTEWARTILGPLVSAAGYEVSAQDPSSSDMAIVFEDDETIAESGCGAVIRLSSRPNTHESDGTIYRYDRESVLAALKEGLAAERRSA